MLFVSQLVAVSKNILGYYSVKVGIRPDPNTIVRITPNKMPKNKSRELNSEWLKTLKN